MASDNRPEIVLDGDVTPFRRKLREAANDLKKFGEDGERAIGGLTGPLATLQSKFVAIGALLAGGAVFKEAVRQAAEASEESIKFGRALGISASEASVLREALDQGNTSQEEFLVAAKGLAKQLRENESGLQAMGLQTRDASGNLRPLNELMLDAIGLLNQYRAGTDRALAGQTMFGKGFEMTTNLADMHNEAVAGVEEQMRSLGLVISQENVAAWQAFDDASDKSNLVIKGLKTTIGNALMPVLTQLGNWFAAIGPAAITVIRGAIGGLVSLFWGLKTAASVAFNLINAAVVQVAEPIRAVAVAFWKLLQGDFEGAKSEIVNIPKVWSAAWSQSFDNILADATEARDKMWELFAPGTDVATPPTKGKSAGNLTKEKEQKGKEQKEKSEPSFMSYYEAELALRKAAFEQENALRQFSKEQELAYWREIQHNLELTSKDRVEIAKRTATLELEIRRKAAKEQRDLDSVMVDSRRAAALAQIQYEEQQANFARENGEITKSELLVLEEQFARRRFEIEYQALLERLELAKSDPNASPAELARIKEQLLEVERNYQLRRGELMQNQKQAGGLNGFFDDLGTSFSQMTNTLLTSATTLRQALGSIFQGIYQSFVQNLITKPLGEWLASHARMLAIKMGFLQAEGAAQKIASSAIAQEKGREAIAVVSSNAAEAGSGAAASQASIPFVGPALALAAMAAVFAAVMALGGKRKSAAGGYDIPKGLNPLTQLHEEEMVLPKHLANVVRNMAGEGGAVAPAPTSVQNIHISALDARSFRDYLKTNSHALAPGLRQLARNFTPVKGR